MKMNHTCHELTHLTLSQATITSATVQPAGVFQSSDGIEVPMDKPFCQVTIRATPEPGSDIGIEVWLPSPEEWNGRFWGIGNIGFAGRIRYERLGTFVNAGYAAVSTDGGNQAAGSGDLSWAANYPSRIVDFAHRAAHLGATYGKIIAEQFYARAPTRAYFSGASTGGHEGLMLAQRYPEDYDGIIAGCADQNWVGLYLHGATLQLWHLTDPAAFVSPPQIAALADAALTVYGGSEGFIENPLRCDPEEIFRAYANASVAPPLTARQIDILRIFYNGPTGLDGLPMRKLGFAPGSEKGWSAHFGQTPDQRPIASYLGNFLANFVYADPQWDASQFDPISTAKAAHEKLDDIMNADDPNIGRFAERGGKLILYHGWTDVMVPARLTLDYYERVQAAIGPEAAAQAVRLFMVPGMGHGLIGNGYTQFGQSSPGGGNPDKNLASALEHWVEHGIAPDTIAARRHEIPRDPNSRVLGRQTLHAWPIAS
jgi:feruloyl esterase